MTWRRDRLAPLAQEDRAGPAGTALHHHGAGRRLPVSWRTGVSGRRRRPDRRRASPDVLELHDIEKPDLRDDGVLVRIRAASLNPADWYRMRGTPYLLRLAGRATSNQSYKSDFAGAVEAVGRVVPSIRRWWQPSARLACRNVLPAQTIRPYNL